MFLDFILTSISTYSLVNGWKSDRNNMSKKKNFGHLLRIIGRRWENLSVPRHFLVDPSSFILYHECYIDPVEYVLNNDGVVLMGVSKDKAWFSVTKSSADTFGLKHYPFAFMAQFFKAEKLLMVDHATLHRISGKIKQFDGNCIMINNTGRCGSTLICQVRSNTYFPFD